MDGDCGRRRGKALEPQRRAQQQRCRGQSGEIPAQRIGANQHSPAREACLFNCPGGWGLGAEARSLEVRSQGDDWSWLREHNLKGASAPQLAGRECGEKSGSAKEARDHCFGVCEERGFRAPLNELHRWAQATAIRADSRDGHETQRLLLQPPRSLCASTGHYPYLPFQELVQPATARVP